MIENEKIEDLLDWFATRVECRDYCPCDCYHETPYHYDEIREEIIRRSHVKS